MIAATAFAFESWGPALRVVALIALFLIVIMALLTLVLVASLPGVVAAGRNHPQADVVRVCGWVGLPTGILWAIALAWSFWDFNSQSRNPHAPALDLLAARAPAIDDAQSRILHLEQLVGRLEQIKGSDDD